MESYSAEDGEVEIEIDDAATSATGTAFDKEVANYKRQTLQEVIDKSEGGKDVSGRMIIDTLKDFGITVYLTEHHSINIYVIAKVVAHVTASISDRSRADYDNQRCFLYRDEKGRLYNLMMGDHSAGLASTWRALLVSFSGLEAMFAITILARIFACVAPENAGYSVRPGYLSLILGLVFYEEMSHVWVNCSMLVRGTPSISAFTLISNFVSDWPRKITIFVLALAGAQANGTEEQRIATLLGIGMAMTIMTANLGARAWHFMKWRPIGLGCVGFLAPVTSLLLALATGLVFPFMGFRSVQSGGVGAMLQIIVSSFIVGLVFMASDLDVVQQYLIVGSESCNQDYVNITIGFWLPLTTIVCLFAAQRIRVPEPHPEDDDPILVRDQSSPVGYTVPNFPDFHIDPVLIGGRGLPGCTTGMEMILGVILSIAVGGLIVSSGFYDFIDTANNFITGA